MGRCGLLIRPRVRPDLLLLPQTALRLRPLPLLRLSAGRPRHPPAGLPPPRHVQKLHGASRPVVSPMPPFATPTRSGGIRENASCDCAISLHQQY